MASIYVHLPFCPYICPYCDFAKRPMRRSEAVRYLQALRAEIAGAPAFSASTAFFGGGTPNTYEPEEIGGLIHAIRARFALPEGAEFSIEVNPDLALCEGFLAYRRAGATRLSIGVQSFTPSEARTLGRMHDAGDPREVVRRARKAGFENLSVDLIFAVPGQTVATWRSSLEAAMALGPEHISAYGLTVEPGTPYAAWQAREPLAFASEDLEADLYAEAIAILRSGGYEQYEISNFAKPGFACAHNRGYWNNDPYLGFGVGAASYTDGVRRMHTRELQAYCDAANAGGPVPGESESLQGARALGEATMLALRRVEGVDTADFARRYGVDFSAYYKPVIAEMLAAGCLEAQAGRIRLTERGRFVANTVCSAFMPLQHFPEGHDYPSEPNHVLKYTSSARLNSPDLR
jgi:oxygen-independent coproporphyrinogen-3 oxidase